MDTAKAVLGIVDYIIFALMLVISASIGVYFRFAGGKQKTTEEFLLAGKDMGILPVAFSLMASFLSAITVIGIPAEMYKFGIHLALLNVGFVIGTVLSSYLFVPVFFNMQASTAYEYLEMRFGKKARLICSVAFVAQMILYMSVVLYAPALALSAVTNLSTWVSVISIGIVCTFYCTMGGMKAVLWTDVFQAILMYICLIAILIKGCMDIGGIGNVYRIAKEGGRLEMPGTEMDLTVRYTVWNVVFQGLILSMSCYGGNQVQIQRLLTVKSVQRSRKALFLSIPMGAGFHLLNCLVGIVIYANFAGCDPLTAPERPITESDQLLPYYVMKSLGHLPGLPGICICGIFSASLSTVSSAVNSLTAVTMEDLVKPFCAARKINQKKVAFSAKAITLFYGTLCVALTFLVANFGNLVQASLTVFGMLGGPVLGVFVLGMMTTRTNEKGAVIGVLTSIALAAWVSFGVSSNGPEPQFLPVSTAECTQGNLNKTSVVEIMAENATHVIYGTTGDTYSEPELGRENSSFSFPYSTPENVTQNENETYIFPLYRLSYLWFAVIGFGSSVIVGYISSICSDIILGKSPKPSLLYVSPLLRFFIEDDEGTENAKKAKSNGTHDMQLSNHSDCIRVTNQSDGNKSKF